MLRQFRRASLLQTRSSLKFEAMSKIIAKTYVCEDLKQDAIQEMLALCSLSERVVALEKTVEVNEKLIQLLTEENARLHSDLMQQKLKAIKQNYSESE